MINFTRKDFEEADKKLNELYEEEYHLVRKLDEVRKARAIAEEERNFIGDWLKRNGATKEEREGIEEIVNPITF